MAAAATTAAMPMAPHAADPELARSSIIHLTRSLEISSGSTKKLDEEEDEHAGISGDLHQLMSLGAQYQAHGQYERAVRTYARVMTLDTKNSEAPLQKAMCLTRTGENDEADAMFQKSLEFYDNVSNPELWHALGTLYALQDKGKQAEEALRQVLQLDPTPQTTASVYFRLAGLSFAGGDFRNASASLLSAKEALQPAAEGGDDEPSLSTVELAQQTVEAQKAEELAAAAAASSGASPAAPLRVIEFDENGGTATLTLADIWFELGDVYTARGDEDQAKAAFSKSGLDPEVRPTAHWLSVTSPLAWATVGRGAWGVEGARVLGGMAVG